MKISHSRKGSTSEIAIEGSLVIDELAQAKPKMLAALEKAREAKFDLGQVSECDAAGLQFLLMAFAGLTARKVKFSVAEPSEAVCQVIDHAGLLPRVLGTAEGRG